MWWRRPGPPRKREKRWDQTLLPWILTRRRRRGPRTAARRRRRRLLYRRRRPRCPRRTTAYPRSCQRWATGAAIRSPHQCRPSKVFFRTSHIRQSSAPQTGQRRAAAPAHRHIHDLLWLHHARQHQRRRPADHDVLPPLLHRSERRRPRTRHTAGVCCASQQRHCTRPPARPPLVPFRRSRTGGRDSAGTTR